MIYLSAGETHASKVNFLIGSRHSIGLIKATQKELIQNIDRSDEALLNKTVPGKDYTFAYLIKGVIDHDIYHLGQLYYLISAAKKANENSGKDD
ncbi:MAG: hypothetical protein ABJG41_05825 [Cyclobacteriaceae bacterium]